MIYKQCIDACFDSIKACDRYAAECYKESKESKECAVDSTEACDTSKKCTPGHCHAIIAAEVCALVGRLTAKGICHKELYELCAKICDECAAKCERTDNQHANACAVACKKCAESCRSCQADCEKCEKDCAKD